MRILKLSFAAKCHSASVEPEKMRDTRKKDDGYSSKYVVCYGREPDRELYNVEDLCVESSLSLKLDNV
uniref:Uncharacterized protein n=1 Tax=Syphacia muris TaxID=451379 RepID=A0A0N5AFJ9_9BILA